MNGFVPLQVNITGTKEDPVINMTLSGIGIKDAAPTFLAQHDLASGGDWGLVSSAAVYAQSTEGLVIAGCNFTRVYGTGVQI
jgi:hypothetical protein